MGPSISKLAYHYDNLVEISILREKVIIKINVIIASGNFCHQKLHPSQTAYEIKVTANRKLTLVIDEGYYFSWTVKIHQSSHAPVLIWPRPQIVGKKEE